MEDAENLEKELRDAERLLNGIEEEVKSTTTEEAVEKTEEAITTEETPTLKTDEEKEEELIPQGEKSRLGRKVKRLESTLEEIKSSLDFLKERSTTTVKTEAEEEDLDLPEGATSEEIKEYIKKDRDRLLKSLEQKESQKTKEQQEQTKKYAKEYTRMVDEMLDPEEDAEVFALMTDTKDLTFNKIYKGDPKEDFLINYRAATKSIMNKSKPAVRTTVAGKPSQIPTGVNVPGRTRPAAKMVDTSKWSAEERELASHFSADELAEMGIM